MNNASHELMLQSTMTQSVTPISDKAGQDAYKTYLKPYLAKLLSAIGLADVCYHRGEGDYLYYQDANGEEQQVLAMLGGYGATLFGHNHPELIEQASNLFEAKRPFVMCGSTRAYARLLVQCLSELIGQVTGQAYIVTLPNSGAEAVEATIKHAELERTKQVQAICAALDQTFRSIRVDLNTVMWQKAA